MCFFYFIRNFGLPIFLYHLLSNDYDSRQLNNEEAVCAFETRLEQYLRQPEHTTLDGKPLDPKLIVFDEKCENNKQTYFETYPYTPKLERIFITPEDRTNFFDIRNKTKPEIQQCLLNMIKVCTFLYIITFLS